MNRKDFVKVSFIAEMFSDEMIKEVRVNREIELRNLLHLTTKVSENILLIGDRGQGKSFLSRLLQISILENHPEVFPVRINLTSLRNESAQGVPQYSLPLLILNQLCKEVWTKVFKKDYSKLLMIKNNPEQIEFYKSKTERRLIEIHNILNREEQKFHNELYSIIGASIGLKGEIQSKENEEWKQRSLLNFEILELIREIKNVILEKHSKKKVILICDEANKLTEEAQQQILLNYLDFFGASQISFLLVERNTELIKKTALKHNIFRVFELEGLGNIEHVKELISKSFNLNEFEISDEAYMHLFESFKGHVFYTLSSFSRCIEISIQNGSMNIDKAVAISAVKKELDIHKFYEKTSP